MPKKGDIREDGKVFLKRRKKCKNGEYWVTLDQFKKFTAREREWRDENKDHLAKLNKDWYQSRTEDQKKKCANIRKLYSQNNPEIGRKSGREYNKRNRSKIREKEKDRAKNNIQYRITRNLRSRLGHAIRAASADKAAGTFDLLGCDISAFRNHIESTFKRGMNWSNYGKWHVDHIVPCFAFDLKKESEQRACFHYSNTQALWAKDNLIKNSKVNETSSFYHLLNK